MAIKAISLQEGSGFDSWNVAFYFGSGVPQSAYLHFNLKTFWGVQAQLK